MPLNKILYASSTIALNTTAAHYLPDPSEDIHFGEDLVKLDIGVCYEGAIGDCAVTIDLSGQYGAHVQAAEAALKAATEHVKVGITVSDLGEIIEKTILSFGLKPVRNLTGHGLGKFKVHTSPHIPNYKDGSKHKLSPAMTFAIEPFVTNGKGLIYESGKAHLFSVKSNKKKYEGFIQEIYKAALRFEGLPFCTHDLLSTGVPSVLAYKAIDWLIKDGVVEGYAPLVEQGGGFVAQAEDSVLIDDRGQVLITTR
jgi:methionyl aminopeptidase